MNVKETVYIVDQLTLKETQEHSLWIAYILAAAVVATLFVVNGRWGEGANVDAEAAAIPAWSLVQESTLDLTKLEGTNPWFVEDKYGRIVSNRAPGLIGIAVPAYSAIPSDTFSNSQASLTALVTTLTAVVLVVLLLRPLIGAREALAVGVVFSLGTTTWAISSAQLWPHGPGQLAALIAVAGFAASRYVGAGAATAWAVTLRPIASIYAAVMGILVSWKKGDIRPALKYGSVAAGGLILVLVYNFWLFGEWSLMGGSANAGLVGGFGRNFSPTWYFHNLWTMFFSLRHGFLTLSPIVLVASYGAIRHRESIPDWAKSAAIAASIYLLVHAIFNRASGGAQVFYRYPLEAIALSAVALGIGATTLYRSSRAGRLLVTGTAAGSIAIQAVNVFYISCFAASPNTLACQIW